MIISKYPYINIRCKTDIQENYRNKFQDSGKSSYKLYFQIHQQLLKLYYNNGASEECKITVTK